MKKIIYSVCESIVPLSSEKLNLPQWLFSLSDTDYQACSKSHIGAGASVLPDGKQTSLNVESVGGHLMVQHYILEISTPNHIKLVSNSDCWLFRLWYVQLRVTWDMKLISKGENSVFRNEVIVEHPSLIMKVLTKLVLGQIFLKKHNKEETPLFAKNILEKQSVVNSD
jgi:hypothetical protein